MNGKTCGYLVETSRDKNVYRLKREPLRRFEDVQNANIEPVRLREQNAPSPDEAAMLVVEAIQSICDENPTTTPDDIGIILVDKNSSIYGLQNILAQIIPRHTGWTVNKAVETKKKVPDQIFVSNRNNVKGLEFPFIICVTGKLNRDYSYRNSLYMTLTRSFLQSHLIITSNQDPAMMEKINSGLQDINADGVIKAYPPSDEERQEIKTTINDGNMRKSLYDFCEAIFDDLNVLPIFRQDLRKVVTTTAGEDFDYEKIKEISEFNYRMMQKRERE